MARSKFLALAVELRIEIYSQYFRDSIFTLVGKQHVQDCVQKDDFPDIPATQAANLLATSKAVYEEAKPLMFQEAVFGIYHCECINMSNLLSSRWSSIKWLVICHRSSNTFNKETMFLIKNFIPSARLKSLVMAKTYYKIEKHEGPLRSLMMATAHLVERVTFIVSSQHSAWKCKVIVNHTLNTVRIKGDGTFEAETFMRKLFNFRNYSFHTSLCGIQRRVEYKATVEEAVDWL